MVAAEMIYPLFTALVDCLISVFGSHGGVKIVVLGEMTSYVPRRERDTVDRFSLVIPSAAEL